MQHDVTILDLPSKIKVSPPPSGVRTIAADISSASTFERLSGPYDAVLHLAAQTSARVSHEEPERDIDTNARGTLLLAQWCVKNGTDRLLYSSSMGVYGQPERVPVDESMLCAPVSFYGVTKLAGEHYLNTHRAFGLNPTIFRLFNVYGPGQDMSNLKQGMVSVYLAYLNEREPVPVTGSLQRFRDFIYIDDVVDAFMLALPDERSYGETYNIGSEQSHTVRELLNTLISTIGYDSAYPVHEVEGHPGDIFGIKSDCTKFRSQFEWRPRVSLQQGIERMVEWTQTGAHR